VVDSIQLELHLLLIDLRPRWTHKSQFKLANKRSEAVSVT
jgi:hypothetical protein